MPCKISAHFFGTGQLRSAALGSAVVLQLMQQLKSRFVVCVAGPDQAAPSKEHIDISAPPYQIEDLDFRLNLACLVTDAKPDASLMQAVSSIDILGGQWPNEALQQFTTLDQSQLLALQVGLSTKPGIDMPAGMSCCQI